MELPDRIEDMTKEQLSHLDMLVDQLDEAFPIDRTSEERLAKDPHLAILPSGRKLSTANVLDFEVEDRNGLVAATVFFRNGDAVEIVDEHDIAAFNAALNDIGVYVHAPTLKGDDADGDGEVGEGKGRYVCADCMKPAKTMKENCAHCGSFRVVLASVVNDILAEGAPV